MSSSARPAQADQEPSQYRYIPASQRGNTSSSNNNNNNNNNNIRPAPDSNEPNPVLATYQRWADATPLVTRVSIILVISMYLFSWIINLETVLSNVPFLSIERFQIYRLLVPSLVGDSFFNVLILMLFYPSMSIQLETSLGSLHFAYLLSFLSLMTNIAFDFTCYLLYFMGDDFARYYDCNGFWVVAFALLTITCMQVYIRNNAFSVFIYKYTYAYTLIYTRIFIMHMVCNVIVNTS